MKLENDLEIQRNVNTIKWIVIWFIVVSVVVAFSVLMQSLTSAG